MTFTGSRTFRFALLIFALYYSLYFIPKIVPGFGPSRFLILFSVSVLLVLFVLLLLAIWGIAARLIAMMKKKEVGPRSKTAGQIALAGFSMYVVFLLIKSVLPFNLPSGSYDSHFDRSVWLSTDTGIHSTKDITPRQKMLAQAIKQLNGKRREEIVDLLGPAASPPVAFEENHSDLIYPLGLQRDALFLPGSEWLLIWLDKEGHYLRHAVLSD